MSARKRSHEVTQIAPLLVEAIEPPIGVQPVDAVSAESIARRVQRPLPYDFYMPVHLIVRQGVTARQFPELDPGAGQREAMQRALQRIERGEPAFQAPPGVDQDAMLRDLDEWRERLRQVFDEVAYGAFLADFTAARNQTLSEGVRAAALERLVPVLRPDWMARKKRLQFAVARRQGSGLSHGELYAHIVMAATSEAVATASVPHDVFLDRKKFTHGPSGDPVVPAYHLREPELIHVLKARVAQLVDEDLAPEIADLKQIKAASQAPWAVETSGDDPQKLQARQVDLANLWAWGTAQARDVLGANGGERTPRTMSGARRAQPETPIGVGQVGEGAPVCLFCGRPQAKHGVAIIGPLREPQEFRHGFVRADNVRPRVCTCGGTNPMCATTKATPNGHVVDTDGRVFSVEALHGVGIKGLEALEAEERIRPQRAAKVEEIRLLATTEQRRLLETMLETGWSEPKDLARHLGKREPAVRKLIRELVTTVGMAHVEPPTWARPPRPAREIPGGTIPGGRVVDRADHSPALAMPASDAWLLLVINN